MIIVLPCVMAPPRVSVALPKTNTDLLKSAVTLEVPSTATPGRASVVVDRTALSLLGVEDDTGELVVAPLIMIADPDEAIEIRSPETVASEPGLIVWDPMMKSEVFWLSVKEFTITGAIVVCPGDGLMVVGVMVWIETALVTSGFVFAPVGDICMLEIAELVLDGKAPLTVAPV